VVGFSMGNSWIGPDEQSMSYGPLLYQLVNDTINVKKVSELAELRQQMMPITKKHITCAELHR